MKAEWLSDGRKIPDDVMSYFRKRAVEAIRERNQSPEIVAEVLGFNRSSIYEWLQQYDAGGYPALETRKPRGADRVITPAMDEWLKKTVLESTPVHHGYDTPLWNRTLLADLIKRTFAVTVDGSTVSLHLQAMGLSYQKPVYQDVRRDEREIDCFLNDKFPQIQKLAAKLGADIGFEDEAGIGVMTRSGRTWGAVGDTPEIPVSMERKGYNLLSMITPDGTLQYTVTTTRVKSEQSIQFLFELIDSRERPLLLLVDRVSVHESKAVRDFVRAHRQKLRIFFLPRRAPELNPDEQVWNEIKNRQIGKQPVKNQKNLGQRIFDALKSLQGCAERVKSFFELPETQYASPDVG